MGMKILKLKYHIAASLRLVMYKALFGSRFSVGGGTTFRRFFNVYLEKGAVIKIGKACFFNHGCSINALEKIEIGDVFLGRMCKYMTTIIDLLIRK